MGFPVRSMLLAVWLVSCAAPALAAFSLTPGITLRQEYDDNIYLESDDEVDDFITKITPSLLLTWESPRLDLSLDARISFEKYWDNSDEDRVGPGEADQGSTFNALLEIYPETFFLRVTDSYRRVPTDEGERGGEGSNVVNLTDSNTFRANPYLQFGQADDLQLSLGYTYENLWYGNEDDETSDDDTGDDSESHIFNASLSKALSPRVILSLGGSHLIYRPKDPEKTYLPGEEGAYEYDRDNVRIGLTYNVSDRLQLEGGYGHAWLDYDVRGDVDSSVWDVSGDYQISSTVKAGLAYVKDYRVSVEDGPSESDRFTAYVAFDDRMRLRLSMFIASEDYVEINRQNDSYGGDISGTLPFTDRFGLNWGLRYVNYDESSSEIRLERINVPLPPNSGIPGDSVTVIVPRVIDTSEEYDRYGTRLALYYDISMGELSAGWDWTLNESDLDDEDYTSNIIYLQASLKF